MDWLKKVAVRVFGKETRAEFIPLVSLTSSRAKDRMRSDR